MFKVGDVVRYADGWCTEAEKKYVFVVVESYETRCKIKCLNSTISLGYYETVDYEMIEEA